MRNFKVIVRLPVLAEIGITAPSKQYIEEHISRDRLSRLIDDLGEYASDDLDIRIQDEASYTDFRFATVEEFNEQWGRLF